MANPKNPSYVLMTELVLPSHTNAQGTIFGGVVMSWIDIAGAIASQRYCKSACVTVSVDYLHFIVPIRIGYTVTIEGQVTHAGTTSMETEINVYAENTMTGDRRKATHAYLTYVALDDFGKPKKVPPFPKPQSEEEKIAFAEAMERRSRRLKWKEELDHYS